VTDERIEDVEAEGETTHHLVGQIKGCRTKSYEPKTKRSLMI